VQSVMTESVKIVTLSSSVTVVIYLFIKVYTSKKFYYNVLSFIIQIVMAFLISRKDNGFVENACSVLQRPW
jgi:hypothetical protein